MPPRTVTLLLSPTSPEFCYVAPPVPPGLPPKVLDGNLFPRALSLDENLPLLGITPNEGAENLGSTVSPLVDVTRLYSSLVIEAGHGDAPRSLEPSVTNDRTPTQSPQGLGKVNPIAEPVITRCSDSRSNHSETISPATPPQFDPFVDDPTGPTQRLPSKFQGPLSGPQTRCRRVSICPTPAIFYASRRSLPNANKLSSVLLPFGSIFRLILPGFAGMEQLESVYCLPAGLLDDVLYDR